MFASKTLTEHLARGVVGAAALVAFGALVSTHAIVAFAMLPVALVALRGCPTCWTMGLVETCAVKVRRNPPASVSTLSSSKSP